MNDLRRSQSGFSLTELSFVLTIGLILTGVVAGGGSYLLNASKGRVPMEFAKETVNALIQYEARRPNQRFPRPASAADLNTGATNGISAFYNTTTGTQYYNPYEGANVNVEPFAFAAGGTHASWTSANYPKTVYAGDVVYFYKSTLTGSPIQVWDGAVYRSYDYYAVQALDERGEPMITLGR